jgi:hypothetical protein
MSAVLFEFVSGVCRVADKHKPDDIEGVFGSDPPWFAGVSFL